MEFTSLIQLSNLLLSLATSSCTLAGAWSSLESFVPSIVYRGHNLGARGYGFYFQVVKQYFTTEHSELPLCIIDKSHKLKLEENHQTMLGNLQKLPTRFQKAIDNS